MKTLIALAIIGSAKLAANDDVLFLQAIAAVESGGDDAAIGPCGAISRYQIMPSTWKQHSSWTVSDALNPNLSQAVAIKHLEWLRKTIGRDQGIPADYVEYRMLACAWRYGQFWYKRSETTERMLDRQEYAARIQNIFNELKTKS